MLISSASTSDAIVSMRDMLMAERMPAGSRFTARVCTIDECRYRLCGITVAPRMPIARYIGSRELSACHDGISPCATDGQCGFTSASSMM